MTRHLKNVPFFLSFLAHLRLVDFTLSNARQFYSSFGSSFGVKGLLIFLHMSVLEIESTVINWSEEITEQLGSRIYPLWNRSAGDCLLDSILQASYGVFDRENTLRRALYDSLTEGGSR